MKKIKLFLFLLISITFVSMTSNVFADHNQVDLKIVKQNSQQVVAKGAEPQEKPNNPCMAKNVCNPCSANPCAGKNPCATNPCATKQPCGAKMKVKPIRDERFVSLDEAISYGEKLWKDPKLGSSGLSCDICHAGGRTYNKTALQAYPHFVSMPNDVVTLNQMINFCMLNPMKGNPLPYGSREMTALSAYFQNVSLKEIANALGSMSANPCAAKNACNPCAVNPCAAKNPCAANPCVGR